MLARSVSAIWSGVILLVPFALLVVSVLLFLQDCCLVSRFYFAGARSFASKSSARCPNLSLRPRPRRAGCLDAVRTNVRCPASPVAALLGSYRLFRRTCVSSRRLYPRFDNSEIWRPTRCPTACRSRLSISVLDSIVSCCLRDFQPTLNSRCAQPRAAVFPQEILFVHFPDASGPLWRANSRMSSSPSARSPGFKISPNHPHERRLLASAGVLARSSELTSHAQGTGQALVRCGHGR